MNKILELIEQILTEKNEKIKPENIKKGVTILGVTGTLEPNETPVKLKE